MGIIASAETIGLGFIVSHDILIKNLGRRKQRTVAVCQIGGVGNSLECRFKLSVGRGCSLSHNRTEADAYAADDHQNRQKHAKRFFEHFHKITSWIFILTVYTVS